jgi:hypothetical protein
MAETPSATEPSKIDFNSLSNEQLLAIARGEPAASVISNPVAPVAPIPKAMPEPVSPMVSVGQGMMDFYGGAKQKYLNLTDPAAAEKYTQQRNEENAIIEKGRGDRGFDFARLGGNIATPLSLIPMGGAGLLGRTVMGAGAGGLGGYLNFDPKNTTESNLTNAAVGTVAGGALGAVLPPVLRGVIQGAHQGAQSIGNYVGSAWRSFAQAVSPNIASNINSKVQITLQNSGIDFAKLPDAVKASVLDDAAQQFTLTGKLDPQMLLRKADIEAVGGAGTATRAQVTRDPYDWTAAQNAQKTEVNIPAVGRNEQTTLTSRYQQQNANTNKYAEALQNQMAAANAERAGTAFDASTQTIEAIRAKDAAAKVAVDDLYKTFRDMGKGDVSVPDTQIAQTLGKIVDEIGVENIPPAVLSRLKEFGFLSGERTKLLTVTEADKLGRLIGNNNPGHGTAGLVSTQLKRAVDNAILDIPEIEASKALMAARSKAKARFADQEAGLAVERSIADVAPDRFFQQNIINGNVRDINSLKSQLVKTPDGEQAWNSLREHVVKWINEKATIGDGVFNGKRMENAIKELGENKLNALFSPAEISQINTLLRGSKAMTTEPAFSAPNRSNTTPSMIGAALRFGNRIPGSNVFSAPISKEVESTIQQELLAKALQSGGLTAGRDAAQAAKREALMKMLMTNRPINPSMIPVATQEQYKSAR